MPKHDESQQRDVKKLPKANKKEIDKLAANYSSLITSMLIENLHTIRREMIICMLVPCLHGSSFHKLQ